jgi:hypothetical protein
MKTESKPENSQFRGYENSASEEKSAERSALAAIRQRHTSRTDIVPMFGVMQQQNVLIVINVAQTLNWLSISLNVSWRI